MYDAFFKRPMGAVRCLSKYSLLFDLFGLLSGYSLWDGLVYVLLLVYPVVDGNSSLGVLLYCIGQAQAGQLPFSKDIVESTGADTKFLGYAALLFVITSYPQGKFIQVILTVGLYFWTYIRISDTFGRISKTSLNSNIFDRIKEKALTYIKHRATM